ncbi:MAG: ATP cone domain-containing protein, partial [Minisyncoccales bacterium]
MKKAIFVINSKGEREPFSKEKVFWSVKRAGGSEERAKEILQLIEKEIYPDISTKEIYKKIKRYL